MPAECRARHLQAFRVGLPALGTASHQRPALPPAPCSHLQQRHSAAGCCRCCSIGASPAAEIISPWLLLPSIRSRADNADPRCGNAPGDQVGIADHSLPVGGVEPQLAAVDHVDQAGNGVLRRARLPQYLALDATISAGIIRGRQLWASGRYRHAVAAPAACAAPPCPADPARSIPGLPRPPPPARPRPHGRPWPRPARVRPVGSPAALAPRRALAGW